MGLVCRLSSLGFAAFDGRAFSGRIWKVELVIKEGERVGKSRLVFRSKQDYGRSCLCIALYWGCWFSTVQESCLSFCLMHR